MDQIVTHSSSWNIEQIESYLTASHTPIRLAVMDTENFPLICSMWFQYIDGGFWCAAHENSRLVSALKRNPSCSFEVSGNEVPYCGVRGRGKVALTHNNAEDILGKLIERYLGNSNSNLSEWLLSRSAEEYAIRIEPLRLTAWDFSSRMSPVKPGN